MCAESKVTDGNQTQVPAAIRARFKVLPGDIVVWEETPDGELRVRFRRKFKIGDLVGLVGDYPERHGAERPDAVRDKKRAQRGGR